MLLPQLSGNMKLVMLFSFLSTLTRGIWDQSILSSYVYLITDHSSFNVGLITGMTGLVQVIAAPITGYISDMYSRTLILHIAGYISCFAVIITIYAVLQGDYYFLCGAMIIWGVFWAMARPTVDALIADSIAQGNRSRVYNLKFILNLVARAGGPLFSMFMFLYMGDVWTISKCQEVIVTGLVLFFGTSLLLFLFTPESSAPYTPIDEDDDEEESDDATAEEPSMYLCWQIPYVPAMIAISDVISGLATGMTIKFFPIFFMRSLSMKPMAVSMLYMITPLSIAAMAVFTRFSSKLLGRIYATVAAKLLGIMQLVFMTYLAYHEAPTWIILVIYVLRSALVNSAKPLTKSVIMDTVPKSQRGRWNALESINTASWSGSALFGGYLIDKYGIYNNFMLTAFMLTLSVIPLLLVSNFVPVEKDSISYDEFMQYINTFWSRNYSSSNSREPNTYSTFQAAQERLESRLEMKLREKRARSDLESSMDD